MTRIKKKAKEEKVYNNGIIKADLYPNQKSLVNGFLPHHLISGFYGSAGKAKDFMQLYYAVKQVLDKGTNYEKIVVVKPITHIGKEIGFLQGSEADKVSPYRQSFVDNLEIILGKNGANNFINGHRFEFEPITFMRGNTFKDCIVILSEAQNCTLHELISVTTRVAETAQLLINGDPMQSDIKNSGLSDFRWIMNNNVEEYQEIELDDSHQRRSPLILKIDKAYREFLSPKKPKVKNNLWNTNKTF